MRPDIEIAKEAKLAPITDVAHALGVTDDELELYGKYIFLFAFHKCLLSLFARACVLCSLCQRQCVDDLVQISCKYCIEFIKR